MSFIRIPHQAIEPRIVVEGEIAFSYADILPGTKTSLRGRHWFFTPDSSKVTVQPGAYKRTHLTLPPNLKDIGFWTIDGVAGEEVDCNVGDYVVAEVTLQQDGIRYFQIVRPFPNSIQKKTSSGLTSARRQPAAAARADYGPVYDYPPIRFGVGGFTPMADRLGDVQTAADIWHDGAAGIEIDILVDYTTPISIPEHYVILFDDLPDDVLGRTDTTPRPHAVYNNQYLFRMGNRNDWSAPGSAATDSQFDFVTVLLHEMGHAIGLGHMGTGVMQPSFSPGDVIHRISGNEEAHVRDMYGL